MRVFLLCALLTSAACIAGEDGPVADAGTNPDPDSGPDPALDFQLVFENLDGALMSVAGSAADDVWAVGGDTRDGEGALILRYDGEGWTRVPAGVEADLWWVHVFERDRLLVGGSGGTLLRYDGASFSRVSTPGDATVWGVWGSAPDDVWVVGGDVDVSPGFVWHFDGNEVHDRTQEIPEAVREEVFFKVFGRRADDVWMVGMNGAAVHWDGDAFEVVDAGTPRRLFTVHGPEAGQPSYVAVGGFGDAVIVEHDGTQWHNVTPEPSPAQLFGVFMVRGDLGYAVGNEGSVLRYDGSAWNVLATGHELFDPLHAVWVDPDGGIWTVGGDVLGPIPSAGMLLHSGEVISDAIAN